MTCLIVQSDKTLLLEVDHPQAEECRRDIAPFAELERSPEHIHTYRITPLALWNARAAGHDAEQVIDALLRHTRYPVPHSLLVDIADTMDRYGRLRLLQHPVARPGAGDHRRAGAGRGGAAQEGAAADRRPRRRAHHQGAPLRARDPQAGAAEGRLAGRGPGRLRRRRTPRHRPARGRLDPAPVPEGGRGGLPPRRLRRDRAPLRRGQDDRRRGRDGRRRGDDADPGHQHRQRAPVAQGAAEAHDPHRGGDRRVFRRPQGDPPGHHRHLPGPDPQDEGRLRQPGAVRRPRLGPDRLRRGPPPPRPGLPLHRRHPVPPPPGPDRHPGPRGRPGRRGLLPDRPQALRRPLEGHRSPGLHRPGGLRGGPRHPHRPRTPPLRQLRTGGEVPPVLHHGDEVETRRGVGERSTPASRPWSSASTWSSWTTSASA